MTDAERENFKVKMRAKLKKRIEDKKKRRANYIPPRYDDVYWQGVAWLDSL